LALMVAATVVCGLLATWQWDRAHQALTDQAAEPAQLGDIRGVLEVGDPVTNEIVGETVTATGSFVPGEQLLVPGRKIEGTEAVLVISALRVELDDGTSARLPVARGWLPAADVTDAEGRIDPALVPAAPQGEIEISGRLEASEAASGGVEGSGVREIATPLLVHEWGAPREAEAAPAGRRGAGEGASGGVEGSVVREIAPPLLVNEWGAPMYAGYVSLDEPVGALRALPAAESDFSRGLNWQNIGYSFQWVIFGGFFLFLWWRSVRATYLDEAAERRGAMQKLLGEDDPAPSRTTAVETTTVPHPDKDV